MQLYRWLFGCSATCLLAVTACSSDSPADPGYYLINPSHANARLDPATFMSAVGCRATDGHHGDASIGIASPTRTFLQFDCRKVDKGVAQRAIRAYYAAVKASLNGAAETAGHYEYYIYGIPYETCYDDWVLTGWVTIHDSNGTFTITQWQDQSCTMNQPWMAVWVPDGGGGGGDDGGTTDPTGGGGGGTTPLVDHVDTIPQTPVARVEVTPGTATAQVGDYLTFTATAYDASDNAMPTPVVTWATSASAIVKLDGDPNAFDGVSGGTATITATFRGVSGSATISVIDDTTTINLNDTTCTRGNLSNCLGRKMSSAQIATMKAAIDTGLVRDTGACHDVRNWINSRPDSLLWDGQNWATRPSAHLTALGNINTEAVLTIFSKGWSGYNGQTLTHTVMHEGFHWWVAVYGDPTRVRDESYMDSLAAACIKAESP